MLLLRLVGGLGLLLLLLRALRGRRMLWRLLLLRLLLGNLLRQLPLLVFPRSWTWGVQGVPLLGWCRGWLLLLRRGLRCLLGTPRRLLLRLLLLRALRGRLLLLALLLLLRLLRRVPLLLRLRLLVLRGSVRLLLLWLPLLRLLVLRGGGPSPTFFHLSRRPDRFLLGFGPREMLRVEQGAPDPGAVLVDASRHEESAIGIPA
jgi:hypothetical protein